MKAPALFVGLIVVALTGAAEVKTVRMLEGEHWWGLASGKGTQQPYDAKTDLVFDLFADNYANQSASFLVSDRGRVLWCDEQVKATLRSGEIRFESRGAAVALTEGLGTLRDAYLFASKKYFPPSGRTPDELFFAAPQYNTWVELTYNQNEKDVLAYAQSMLDNGLPPGILMIDDTWQLGYGTWQFDPRRFADPKGMVRKLHGMGFKVMLWVCPWVSMDSPEYRELVTGKRAADRSETGIKGGFYLGEDGTPAACPWWNGKSALLDFTNPNAGKWFRRELDRLQRDYGIDGFKFDGGEMLFYNRGYVPHDKTASSGLQTQLYSRFAVEYPVSEYRNAWQMGGQPIVERLYDKGHTWQQLQLLVPDMLAAGILGHSFVCPDMAGGGSWTAFLPGAPFDAELFIRAVQIHALCGMMQFSASPWRVLKDEAHRQLVRDAVALRQKFAPYFLETAKACAASGEPMIRYLAYSYPGQGYEKIRDQFLLGDRLLVAPVQVKGQAERQVAIPPGKWLGDDGVEVEGPKTLTVSAPLSRLPHWTRVK